MKVWECRKIGGFYTVGYVDAGFIGVYECYTQKDAELLLEVLSQVCSVEDYEFYKGA